MPKYEHIKFLAIDMDLRSFINSSDIGEDEFFDITHPCCSLPYWLDYKSITPLNSVQAASYGIRQVGRWFLINNCSYLVEKLANIIKDAKKDLISPSLNIHIFTGLAGGTGGGIFIDFCYILQHVLDNMGLADVAKTCGYFFLPDVNMQNHSAEYLKSNGFAAMKELDYCMNFDNNGDKWEQQYDCFKLEKTNPPVKNNNGNRWVWDGFKVKTTNPPVKFAYLVTATKENGDIIPDGYNYVMNVVSDYVLEYIMKSNGTFTMESHVNNINKHIAQVHKTHGGCYNYFVIGAASAYVPYNEINTYLVSKIFECFEGLRDFWDKEPSDRQIEEFVQNNGFRYEDIKQEVQKGIPDIRKCYVDSNTLLERVRGLTPGKIPGVFKKMRDDVEKGIEIIEENILAMKQDGNATSFKERIKRALIEIATGPDKGFHYANKLLGSDNAGNLLYIIDGYKKRQEAELEFLNKHLEFLNVEMAMALEELQNDRYGLLFGRGSRDRRAERYQVTVNRYFAMISEINVVKAMGSFFDMLKKQLEELKDEYFLSFEVVMITLKHTFSGNLWELSNHVTEDTGYERRIVSVEDIKDSLDRIVEEMNIPDQLRKFTDNLILKPEIWMERDDNKISAEVTDYFLKQLGKYSNMTIIEYLKDKYKTSDAAVLSRFIENDIIADIDSRANVKMWVGKGYEMVDAVSTSLLSIPFVQEICCPSGLFLLRRRSLLSKPCVQEIEMAANDYVGNISDNNSWMVRSSCSSDRISLFRIKCGVPLFAYKGIEEYLPVYKASKIVGQHLYENNGRDPRDGRKLINVAPLSIADPDDYSYLYDDEDLKFIEAYDSFFEKKIITKTVAGFIEDYTLNLFDESKMDALEEEAEELIKEGDPFKIESFLKGLNDKGSPDVEKTVTINNNGYPGFEEQVIRDHIFGSQIYKAYALKSLEISERFEKLKERLMTMA